MVATLEHPRADRHVLVIVESPGKAMTIANFLGEPYDVLASMGHLKDLPKSRLGVDLSRDFEPEYLTIRGKAKILKDLQRAARKYDTVLLASDHDREGEAISSLLRDSLVRRNGESDIRRVVFNEITPQAVREALERPRAIDDGMVNAQKARRVLDRIVGYSLSPLLWKKVKPGLSAGRVQSVALRLICEREREVENFAPTEYWTIRARFRKGRSAFEGELESFDGKDAEYGSCLAAAEAVDALRDKPCTVSGIEEGERTMSAKPPFTTSRLLQVAARRLGFSSKKTMQLASQLYEGVDIDIGRMGLITYMRSDSTRVSGAANAGARLYIGKNFPAELPPQADDREPEGGSVDAYEAIRPTLVEYSPEKARECLTRDQWRLYAAVWERFVASRMTDARGLYRSIGLSAGPGVFRVRSLRVVEQGYRKALKSLATEEDVERVIPELRLGEAIKVGDIAAVRRFTRGKARYTDASIVETLEELRIGRASTYAPIVSVLLERWYVTRENGQLVPTALGRMINDILVESFPAVVDAGFTAGMEALLDDVEAGKRDWVPAVREFWGPFKRRTDELAETLESFRGAFDEATDRSCEKCGKPLVKRIGKYGFFLACTGFPDCRNTKSVPLARCPRPGCSGEIVARKKASGRGREFYGCTRFPECGFMTSYKPTASLCPACGWFLVERFDGKEGTYRACINPDCDRLRSREADHA